LKLWLFELRIGEKKRAVGSLRNSLERLNGADKEGKEPIILFAMQPGKFK
jgi:hypothetical protein